MRLKWFLVFLLPVLHSLFSTASSLLPNPCDPNIPDFCLIKTPIISTGDLIYSTDQEIVILFTQIYCQNISLTTRSKITIQGSRLKATSIVLIANDTIIYDSMVSTNGTIPKGKGYTSVLLQGFGYAGMGSVCIWWEELTDNSYGHNCAEFWELDRWDKGDTQGSGGIRPWEFGGGRIIIKANNRVYLSNSDITASGFPTAENAVELCANISDKPYSKGGTGGFILIEAEEIKSKKFKTKVEVQGGYYCGRYIVF